MNNKIIWLSILQGWAMFLVVLGHCSQWTQNEWCKDMCYGVHMPLFMFISGGLFYITRIKKNWKWKDVILDKLKRLGVPYVFFIMFAFGVKVLFVKKVKHEVDISLVGFLRGFIFPIDSGMKEMWFVAALLLIMFVFPFYKSTLYNKVLSGGTFFFAALLPYYFDSYTGSGIFNWQGALHYFIFFYGGILFFKYKIVDYLKIRYFFLGWVIVVIYFIVCIFRKEQTVLVAFCGIIGFIWICKWLSESYPNILASFRDYSFQIFLLGIYPQMFVELFLTKNFTAWWMQPILLILSVISGLYIPVVIAKIVKNIGNKYIETVLGLK